jgi:predicted nucleic-acid-binding Zn-ribbon protein
MYDYFRAQLRCPRCENISAADAHINMQTYMRNDADGSELAVGHLFEPIELTTKHILSSGYALISEPKNSAAIRLLDVWSCPKCETDQWATVEIAEARIVRIEAVAMSLGVLESANFITEVNAELLAAALLDIPTWEVIERKLDVVTVLRQHLQ